MKNDLPAPLSVASTHATNGAWAAARTTDEIKAWRKLSPYHRTTLSTELKRRVKIGKTALY